MAESRRQSPRVHVLPVRVAAAFGVAPVLHFLGMVFTGLGVVMLIPALVEQDVDALGFVAAAAVTLFTGVTLALGFAGEKLRINLRQGVLAVILTWLGAGLFGSLPFQFAQQPMDFTDAIFETISGLSSTGSTVFVGLDQAPRGILLWRFLLIWLGGFGLVTFAVLILPYLRIGGLQLFMVDLSARPGKFLPKTAEVVAQITIVYVLLTLACAIAFGYCRHVDVRCHRSRDVGDRHRRLLLARRGHRLLQEPGDRVDRDPVHAAGRDAVRAPCPRLAGRFPPAASANRRSACSCWSWPSAILLLALWRLSTAAVTMEQAFREASFNVVSIISTTGLHLARLQPLGRVPLDSCSCAPC